MSKQQVLKVAVGVPLSRRFDYLPPADGPPPAAGCRVRVPFGRRRQVGLVMDVGASSELAPGKLKRAEAVLDETPLLSADDLWLIRFTSDYYHHPVGEVAAAALPALLRHGKALYPVLEML
ncbi:MAG: primosomal protein N', partial [Woeseiaceae bacterium]|nr:primosomal protein N' [Woeseiaceae bacterium]